MLKHIQDMALFALLVKNGSFTRTASELGMTKSRISQRISCLEEALGFRLLNRTTRKITLTTEGEYYLSSCREILNASARGDETMQKLHKSPGGNIKIISPPGFMSSILPTVHHDFLKDHPNVELQLATADSFYGTVSDEFDIAYRIGSPSDDAYIGRFLGMFRRFIICTPEYRQQHKITHPEALLKSNLITHRTWRSITLSREDEHYKLAMSLRHTSDNLSYILQLALRGAGMAILPEYLVKPYIEAGQLQVILTDWTVQQIELWMIYQSKINNPVALRDYINFVVKYNILDVEV
jgi:DNA-binding transcriptional LysR family regulator